jgi:hypothetical protein
VNALLEAGGSRVGEIADLDDVVMADHRAVGTDPRRCEIVLGLLAKKWMIPILVELDSEPRRRQYLFNPDRSRDEMTR